MSQQKRKKPAIAAEPSSLAHYDDAALYEATFSTRKQDVAFFVRLAQELRAAGKLEGPILEFGAGAGRITIALLKAGFEVLAVEPSSSMRARLLQRSLPRRLRERLLVVDGDMRDFEAEVRFDLILATFNVVGHLKETEEFQAFLQSSKELLSARGRLVFDVPIPHPNEIDVSIDDVYRAPRFKHPTTREWIRHTERFLYDAESQVLTVENDYRVEGQKDILTVPLVLRQWFPREVESLLKYAGFQEQIVYADYEDKPGLLALDTLIYSTKT